MSKRCVIYGRVSTAKQDPAFQIPILREFAAARGFEVVKVLVDRGSGGKFNRAGLVEARELLRSGKASVLLSTRLSRVGRSWDEMMAFGAEIEAWGAHIVCSQQDVDTTTPQGRAFFRMCIVFDEFERELKWDVCREGEAAQRAELEEKGAFVAKSSKQVRRHWGRPRVTIPEEAIRAVAAGAGLRPTALEYGVSARSLGRAVEAWQKVQRGDTPQPSGNRPGEVAS